MSPPIRLDDLEREQGTEPQATPPRKRRAGEPINLDELEGTAPAPAAPARDTGNVDLRDTAKYPPAPVVPPEPTPAPRRGIGGMVSDLVDRGARALDRFGRTSQAAAEGQQPTAAAVAAIPDEQRRLAVISDRRTPEERLAGTRRRYDATIAQRPDVARVAPAGSTQASAEATATQAMGDEHARQQRNFTPEQLRDLAKRGMARAAELNAQAVEMQKTDPVAAEQLHQHAEDFSRKAYNSQVLADDVGQADTFDAVVLSNMLGVLHDPYAGQQRNIAEAAQGASTFTPEEQQRDLGKNSVVPASRDFSLSDPRDVVAPLIGGAPLFIAGDAAVAAGARGLAEFAGARLPVARRIAEAIGDLYGEARAVEGPRQAGLAGLKESAQRVVADAPQNIKRGMTMGQVPGAVLAAREAQQRGEDPTQAAVGSVLGNALLGPLSELGFHAAGEFGRFATRTDLNIGRRFFPEYGMRDRPVAADAPTIARAVEGAREVQGQTALADKTDSGQHATIAKLLDTVLGEKGSEEAVANEVLRREATRPMIEPATNVLRPRADENVPLRSAAEIAGERAGPAEEANALTKMERARREAAMQQEEVARQIEQVRIERAAAERTVQQHGPKTLRETLETAGREHAEGDPLATEYHDAINTFADAAAAMKDAGDTPNERTKLRYARAKQALDSARKRYGTQAGAAAIVALAQANSDLTDDERKMIGLGALAVGTVEHVRGLPVGLRDKMLAAVEAAPRALTRQEWLDHFAGREAFLGEHYTAVNEQLSKAAKEAGGLDAPIAPDVIRRIFEAPKEVATIEPEVGRLTQTTQRAVRVIDTINVEGGQMLTPAQWATKFEAAGLSHPEVSAIESALRQDGSPTYERSAVKQLLRERNLTPADDAPRAGSFYSRLGRAVETLPGKAWDQPRPAGDWLGKLKGMSSFAKTELAMIEPRLQKAVEQKVKLSRADVLNLVEDYVPRVERHTLAYDSGPRGNAAHGDPDEIIDIDDLHDATRDEIRQQIDNREAEIERVESGMNNRIDEAYNARENADEEMQKHLNAMKETIDQHFPNSGHNDLDPGLDYLRDHVEGEYIPRGAVDTAFNKIMEEGNFFTHEEPLDPADIGLDVEEGEKNGEPWFTIHYDNETFEGATRWEALAKAEHAGVYDSGGEGDLLPKGYTVEKEGDRYVLKNRDGRSLWSDTDREALMDQYVSSYFEPKSSDSALSELKDDLQRYAEALSEWNRAESEHYWMSEGEAFEQERSEIEGYRSQISDLEDLHDDAPAARVEGALPAAGETNPLLTPIARRVTGKPQFESYQRIGGGTHYRELLNVWENNPGEKFKGGHWRGTPDTVSHIRVEDQAIEHIPGLTGERVEYPADEREGVHAVRREIEQVRAERDAKLAEQAAITAEYERLPADVRDDVNSGIARSLASRYKEVAGDVSALAEEESRKIERLKAVTPVSAESERAMNVIESQSDLAQNAAEYGVQRTLSPEEQQAYTHEIEPAKAKLSEVYQEDRTIDSEVRQLYRTWNDRRAELSGVAGKWSSEEIGTPADYREGINAPDSHAADLVRLREMDPQLYELAVQFDQAKTRQTEVVARMQKSLEAMNAIEEKYGQSNNDNRVPPGPYTETRVAHALNVSRALIEAADRGYDTMLWSDAANRVKHANLPIMAANLTYDQLWPSLVKGALGTLGFKNVPLTKTFIRGAGHWTLKLTPEMRAAIRKVGLPVMGVLGAMAVPQDAEAQDGKGEPGSLYKTALGGIAAGTLLYALSREKRLRSLVKENRELNRALMMDDLSGLSNQKAFLRARESVDRDPTHSWVVFDGDQFKRINDTFGHSEGDKVIQHFGDVLRKQAEAVGIPQRLFRSGGDEFSVAVPKGKEADLLRAVEDGSEYTLHGVTTKLSGAIGDTHGEADALLNATKEQRRLADPSLVRPVRPEIEAKLTKEIAAALDRAIAGGDAPVQREIRNLRSGKISPETLIAVASVPFMVTAGALAGNTPEEKKTNMLLGAVLPAVLIGGTLVGKRAIEAARKVLADRKLADADRWATEALLYGIEVTERRASGEPMFSAGMNPYTPAEEKARQTIAEKFGMDRERRRAADKLIEEVRGKASSDYTRPFDVYANPIGPALAELRKYPSAAAVGLVGYAMTDSDNEQIRRAGVPTMALAGLSAIGSRRLAAGADKLGSLLVERLRQSPEGTAVTRFFNPDALLTPEVRQAIREYERGRAKGVARAKEFSGKAKKLGPAGDRAVSDVLEGESWEDTSMLDPKQTTDVLSVAGELSAEYDRLTQAQVAAGTLHPNEVLPNYGGPRKYAFYDAMDALADSPRAGAGGGAKPRIAGQKSRTLDIPIREAEAALREATATGDAAKIADAQSNLGQAQAVQMSQRLERGEIREASYRAAAGIEKAHNNIAAAKLFETIRNVPGATHPEWTQAVDDMLAAKDLYKNATSQADRDAAHQMQNDAAVALDAVSRKYRARGGDYVTLPDAPSMGVLRGAVVKRDIAHSLEGFGQPGTYGKLLRAWKEIKTVFNPGTSIGNILSNVTALHMGDVPMWLQPYYYTQAARDLRSYGEATRTLAEAGVLNVNSVNALGTGELGRGMRTEQGLEELLPTTRFETARVLREQGISEAGIARKAQLRQLKGAAAGAVLGGAKGYDPEDPSSLGTGAAIGAGVGALFNSRGANRLRRLYDNEDNIARLAVFLRRRKLGDSIEQARDRAVRSLGDFRSRSPALRMVASTVSPFIMYQAKAVPAFARNVVDHPWKYLTLMAAWGAVNELGKQEMGEIPETDIPVPDRRTYGYFFPGFTQLPFGDKQGSKAAVDMARWTPMAGLTTGAPPGSVPEAFSDQGQQIVTPGGPVIDAALQLSNVDPYSKGPLLHRDYPTSENVATLAHKAADFALPSAMGLHLSRLKTDLDNADFDKFKNDLLGPTGIKPRYIRPGAVIQDASFTLERDLRDMQAALVRDLRANKDDERKALLVDRYRRRVGTALINFKSRMGAPPDPAIVDQYFTSPDAGATSEP